MNWWKNLLLNKKLALSYGVLIIVFLLSGSFTILSFYAYKKELSVATSAYIPLVDNTNKIERVTNQTMFSLWEYTALGEQKYYELSKSTLAELSASLLETGRIISASPELYSLRVKLMRISQQVTDLNQVIDETANIQAKLKANQQSLKAIASSYTQTSKQFLNEGESELFRQLSNRITPAIEAKERHRKNRLISVVVDKGNTNMIAAFEAISFDNIEYLEPAFKAFDDIFILLNRMASITEGTPESADIRDINLLFIKFRDEVHILKDNLIKHRALSIKRGDIADAVINEARSMGEEGIILAGSAIQDKYKKFDNLITFFYIGLAITFIIALVFSILITRSITVPLAKSVKFAEEIASGNLDASVQIEQEDEVGMLALSLRNMGVKLKENLEELKQVEREMLSLSIETEEKERKRFAEDLHDSLGPLLSTIKLFINALKDSSLPQERKEYLINSAEDILLEAIATVKDIAYNLLPNLLSDFGLEMAIRSFCDKIKEVTNININYSSEGYSTNYNRHIETMLFRIVKELTNNTIKHASANSIDIKLYFDEEFFHIDYIDNGKGFDFNMARDNNQRGLINIFSRVNYLKGDIKYITSPGEGVKVSIKVEKKSLFMQ